MAILPVISVLVFAQQALALKYTPGSPCASVCQDDLSQDVSNLNIPNMSGSDITCVNTDTNNTPEGQRFKTCIDCLQNSTSVESDQNDQELFLYNLRYALDSCLFDFSNATDAVSTPCSTDLSCGPLQAALEYDNLSDTGISYGYCSADTNAFLGSFLPKCISCLQDSIEESYLSNYLIALQAGCLQQPPAGTLIGLDSYLFIPYPVNITSPGQPIYSTSSSHKLSQGAIIGIVVTLAILFLVACAVLFICLRKRRVLSRLKKLQSPLDHRFGASNITSPTGGSYANPYARAQPYGSFDPQDIKRVPAVMLYPHSGTEVTNDTKKKGGGNGGWVDVHAHLAASQNLPVYSPSSAIPTHQAYIPSTHSSHSSPAGPITSPANIASTPSTIRSKSNSNTYVMPPYPSSKTPSPNQLPPIQTTISSAQPRSLSCNESRNRTLARERMKGSGSEEIDIPVKISGPMIRHGGRFDVETAERERKEQEERQRFDREMGGKKNAVTDSPESVESQELWPGSY
jgi:hypothetical protein